MKYQVFLILLTLSTSLCSSDSVEMKSPDETYIAEVSAPDKTVYLRIIDNKNGKTLYQCRNGASIYKEWSGEWVGIDKFMLRSSDIGNYIYERNDKNEWTRIGTNECRYAPQGSMFWSAIRGGANRTVRLDLNIKDSSGETIIRLFSVETELVIKDLSQRVSSPDPRLVSQPSLNRA